MGFVIVNIIGLLVILEIYFVCNVFGVEIFIKILVFFKVFFKDLDWNFLLVNFVIVL